MDEIHVTYKLALLFLHIPEFIIIKKEKCFLTKGSGTMVIDAMVALRYTDRHVAILVFLYPSSLVPHMPFSDTQGVGCFEINLRIHGLLAAFTFLYSANI